MVFAEIGGAASVGAVLDDADAIDVEAPDDRPARGAGREGEPVMPGFENRRSPSWAVPSRRISSFGTTVTVANRSVTTGSTPC